MAIFDRFLTEPTLIVKGNSPQAKKFDRMIQDNISIGAYISWYLISVFKIQHFCKYNYFVAERTERIIKIGLFNNKLKVFISRAFVTSDLTERVVENAGKERQNDQRLLMSSRSLSSSPSLSYIRVVHSGSHSLPPVTPRTGRGAPRV